MFNTELYIAKLEEDGVDLSPINTNDFITEEALALLDDPPENQVIDPASQIEQGLETQASFTTKKYLSVSAGPADTVTETLFGSSDIPGNLVVLANTSSAAAPLTIVLPSVSHSYNGDTLDVNGIEITVKVGGTISAQGVEIVVEDSSSIDGASSVVSTTAYETIRLMVIDGAWYTV